MEIPYGMLLILIMILLSVSLMTANAQSCRPRASTNQVECLRLIRACERRGILMKWGAPACRSSSGTLLSSGGCQCSEYCAYACEKSCRADDYCVWSNARRACLNKKTMLPGLSNPNCEDMSGTSTPSQQPSQTPTTSTPSGNPTTSVPSRTPSRTPSTSTPSGSPTTSTPSRTPSRVPSRQPSRAPIVPFDTLIITLTWSTNQDMDLAVVTPNSNLISYQIRGPAGYTDYGFLSDDSTSFGPEIIRWTQPEPIVGTYVICVDPFDVYIPTNYTLNISRPNFPDVIFTGSYSNIINPLMNCQNPSDPRRIAQYTYT